MKISPTVIIEHTDYLVINKPAGLVVHGDGRTQEPTLVDWILEKYPEIAGVGEDWTRDDGVTIPRPGIVHRLDRDTSGVMIIARTQGMFDHLKKQFQNHTIVKKYHAIAYGAPKADTGTIDVPIGRSKKDFRLWATGRGTRGALRDATTDYHVVARFSDEAAHEFSYIAFQPKTGRTHQIRVHAKHTNHPLVGDERYAGKRLKKIGYTTEHYALGFNRQALHARSIEFLDLAGNMVSATADFPHDFVNTIRQYAIMI